MSDDNIDGTDEKTSTDLDRITEALDGRSWNPNDRYGCPLCLSSHSVSVNLGDTGAPVVHCFACDDQDRRGVWRWLKELGATGKTTWTAEQREAARLKREQRDKEAIGYAQGLVWTAKQSGRKPGKYLKARGIDFVPRNCYLLEQHHGKTGALFPIEQFQSEALEVVGCHIVWLNETLDGKIDQKLQKQSYGRKGDGFVRAGKFTSTKLLIIAEGVETMLSAVQLAGGTSEVAGIAACGSIGSLSPLDTIRTLPQCSEVIIARDRNKPGNDTDFAAVARDLAERIKKAVPDLRVRIVQTRKRAFNDWNDILQGARDPHPIDPQAIWDSALDRAEEVEAPPGPLDWKRKYMVSAERIQDMHDAKMALPGQIPWAQTLIYCAESGSGKTTLCMHQAAALVKLEYSVTYVNADIGMSEAKEATRLAQEGKFDLLPDFAEGEHGGMDGIVKHLDELAASDVDLSKDVWFFDNLKKMNDMMSKRNSARLYKIFRRLTTKGMTIVVQAHTNKYPKADGTLVYEGTGDLRTDNDNLCYVYSVANEDGSLTCSIKPDKKRAVLDNLTFEISLRRELKWRDQYTDVSEIFLKEKLRNEDQTVIELITQVIRKRKAPNESEIVVFCQDNHVGRRTTMKVLNRYIGELWDRARHDEHNAKIYTLRA